MAEFKLERFKYVWRGDWVTGTVYSRDDIIRVKGRSYVCLVGHTASTDFREDLDYIVPESSPPLADPRWRVMTSGRSFVGPWSQATSYDLGDVIFYQGTLWECTTNHTATAFSSQSENWTSVGSHQAYVGTWDSSADYVPGALVRYNGITYKCVTAHAAGTLLEDNAAAWEVFLDNTTYAGEFVGGVSYRKNDLVRSGGTLYRCTESHTAGLNDIDITKFVVELPGFDFDGEWNSATYYQIGDVVIYSGNAYYAIQNNTNQKPFKDKGSSVWVLLSYSYNFKGDYSINANYKPGDVIQRGGDVYIAVSEVEELDGSTNDFLDPSIWEKLIPSVKWNNVWNIANQYYPNDLVIYKGSTWNCVEQHISADNNFPGDNGSGFEYWELFIQAGLDAGLEDEGDLLTYGLSRGNVGDGSTKGPTNVPIGNYEEFLSVDSDIELYYRDWISDSDVVYVSMHGKDQTGYGLESEKPFKTIQYASEFVLSNYDALTPVKIRVSTGRYYETLPITVPAGCTIMGDELRSTTIQAAGPDSDYADDFPIAKDGYITRWSEIMEDFLTLVEIENTVGNDLVLSTDFTPSTSEVATAAVALLTNFVDYLEFYINDTGVSAPTITGSNAPTLDVDREAAINIIEQNKAWLQAELLAYRQTNAASYDMDKVKRDILVLIDSVLYDLKYEGNYRTLRAAEVYYNRYNGSTNGPDMFYLRDTTGIRQLTVDGIVGSPDEANVFELYQRPTGGAYCALDPGWGPDDQSVWINNRSPYIQGVTTLGTFAIGQKVDGNLHNGGNRSFVSNDFTQVISDGIGAWVTNGARAELVSVFTYYAAIGYLAEDGGIIRATNGNNSYGVFGSVSIGIDPNETPINTSVDNTNNDAIVNNVYAGEFQDEVFLFEYVHCGQNYTTATADVVGAGGGIDVVFDQITDGSIFQSRLLNEGSGLAGGSGYSVYGNNAQVGNTTQITLAQSDNNQDDTYNGMRILIVSGDGTGQYAIVDDYVANTKVATVRKESTGEPGWDHIVPGTTIEPALSNNCVYRIEPRIVVSDPGFEKEAGTLPNERTFKDLIHGETSQNYAGITLGFGTGEIDASVVPTGAVVNVLRSGQHYEVTIVNPGSGYAIGDEITILGSDLGGQTPANDCVIRVTANSDDSTNSIQGIVTTGTALSGIYVAVAQPNFIVYSADAQDWNETFINRVRNWHTLANGNGKFVLIADDDDRVGVSSDGINWTFEQLPANEAWSDVVFAEGKFVICAEDSNTVISSTDGVTWTQATIPDDTLGDSTASQWTNIAHGGGRFVVIAGNDRAVAYSEDAITWTRLDTALPAGAFAWVGLTYGKNRFVAVDRDGATVYSLDLGLTWAQGPDMPLEDGSTTMKWNKVKFANGSWFALSNTDGQIIGADATPATGATSWVATSSDGYNWQGRDMFWVKDYSALTYNTLSGKPTWVVLANNSTIQGWHKVRTGAQAKFRAVVNGSQLSTMEIWDPGSGYVEGENDPTLTIFDNTYTSEVLYNLRLGDGVLGQPTFRNRGTGYRTSTTRVTITGDGFADIVPEGTLVTLIGVPAEIPGPGAQLRFTTIEDLDTEEEGDLKIYTVSTITDLGDDGQNAGTKRARFQITPSLQIEDGLQTGTTCEIRTQYSQCRISGHDFLDIGTGNFQETNYPAIYRDGNFFVAAPEYEVFEVDGGRVFYTSTDQNGNFRGGELFAVEQATGIVTISAEFFNLDGLSELALGGVRLGGSGTVVREFSTDVNFTEDSNNVIPTQRAIATFFSNRLSQGGSEIATNNLQAGVVLIGSEANRIDVVEGELFIPVPVHFNGGEGYGIQGSMLAQTMFLRQSFFNEDRA